MRALLSFCAPPATTSFPQRSWASRAADEILLARAQEQDRILITRDRDYGSLVFLKSLGAGVIYLRMLPSTQEAVHGQLAAVLREHSQEELGISICRSRTRRLPNQES